MSIKDKRFGIWEGMMLLCGFLSAWLYALNFGISQKQIPATVVAYVISCLTGGGIAWLVYKGYSGWKRAGYTFLFATFAYGVIEAAVHILFPNPYDVRQSLFADALLYWCLASLLPVLLFSFSAIFFQAREAGKKVRTKLWANNLCICGIIRSFATAFAQSLSGTTEKAWYVA